MRSLTAASLSSLAIVCAGASPVRAQQPADLSALSIEDLANIQVTSVSKRAEPLSDAPAAIYVIGNEDIRRSTANSLAEALRLAPNLQVQQIDARQYAISARGFNGYETSNKLLGLIDGRSIYTSLHAGIFWDLHTPVLEDIDQIEVVSGPGGTLWGPNAVNGVISVATKSALDTQGLLARATAGAQERTGVLRYGGGLGDGAGYRVYATLADREGTPEGAGMPYADGALDYSFGVRADWAGERDSFMAQAELFRQDLDIGVDNEGHHLLARWKHDFAAGSALQVQAYYDSFKHRFPGVLDAVNNYDLSVQQNIAAGRHEIMFGGGIRMTRDLFVNQLNPFVLDPPSRTLWLGNFFAQDTISLSGQLDLIAGLKVERASFTGLEWLPNVRLAWRPAEQTLLWGAVSRSVRTPSRIDRNLVLPGFLLGGTFESERVIAIEGGYRGEPIAGTRLSVSLFYNIYDGLRTTESATANLLPLRLANGLEGHSYGIEAWANHRVMAGWRVSAGISTLHKSFKLKKGHVDIQNGISLGNDPDFQILLRSQADLTEDIRFDLQLRGVDSLPNPQVDGYVEADARIAWALEEDIELFVAGANLLHKRRDESGDRNRGQLVVRRIAAGTRLRF